MESKRPGDETRIIVMRPYRQNPHQPPSQMERNRAVAAGRTLAERGARIDLVVTAHEPRVQYTIEAVMDGISSSDEIPVVIDPRLGQVDDVSRVVTKHWPFCGNQGVLNYIGISQAARADAIELGRLGARAIVYHATRTAGRTVLVCLPHSGLEVDCIIRCITLFEVENRKLPPILSFGESVLISYNQGIVTEISRPVRLHDGQWF